MAALPQQSFLSTSTEVVTSMARVFIHILCNCISNSHYTQINARQCCDEVKVAGVISIRFRFQIDSVGLARGTTSIMKHFKSEVQIMLYQGYIPLAV